MPSTVEDPVGNAPNERWRGEERLELERQYRGLNNYLYYFKGFLTINVVQSAPKPYSNY